LPGRIPTHRPPGLALALARTAGCPDITAILPAVRDGGRVYLVVSDVAELARWLDVNLDPSYHRPADFDPPPAA
jgi:hypothetical protein